MPSAQPLRLPPDSPEGHLLAILEPYLWLDQITPVRTYGDPEVYDAWLEVRGVVKFPHEDTGPWPEDQDLVFIRAAAVRQSLYNRAETAIFAADDAGYVQYKHPEIEITGRIERLPSTLDSQLGLEIPVAEATLRMWLRPPWTWRLRP